MKGRILPSETVPVILLCSVTILLIHLHGTLDAGFYSDDYDFIAISRDSSGLTHLEGHHHSLLVPMLFRLTASGSTGAGAWHVTALAAHLASVFLLWFLVRRRLGAGWLPSAGAAMLASALPAGMEGLAWPGALGYPLSCTLLLAALVSGTGGKSPWNVLLPALIQLAAWAAWDWAVLLAPAVVLARTLLDRRVRLSSVLKENVPLLACWVLPLAIVLAGGHTLAYRQPGSPVMFFRAMLGTPLVVLLPLARTGFLASSTGIASAVAVLAVLAYGSVRDRRVLVLVAVAWLYMLPWSLFGVPQSRYLYIPAVFFLAALSLIAGRLRPHAFSWVLITVILAVQAVQARQLSVLWRDAWSHAQQIRESIDGLPPGEDLLIVNLPDTWGPEDMLFRPWVWRNGMSAFSREFRQVATPDAPYGRTGGDVRLVERELIPGSFPGAAVYEVVMPPWGSGDRHRLVRLD